MTEAVQTSVLDGAQGTARPTASPGSGPHGVPSLPVVEELYRSLGVGPHPILGLPSAAQVAGACATAEGQAELVERLRRRQRRIALSEADPLEWGFEAETWRDADALLSAECGVRKAEWGTETCEVLAIFGGNRAQKTYYAVKRAVQCAEAYPGARLALCSETDKSSVANLQVPLVWPFLRPRYGHLNGKRHAVTKINYTQGNGFTDGKVVLPNGSELYFLTYNSNPGDYEGWEFGAPAGVYEQMRTRNRVMPNPAAVCDEDMELPPNIGAVADESMPLSWLQMLLRRCRFRQAKLAWTFTPVKGITPAVKELVGASAVTLEHRKSELLPRQNLPDLPAGTMPYVRRCSTPGAYAIYFFTEYNRWGPGPGRTYYQEVQALCAGKDSSYVERVAYGFARDSVARAFPKFGPWNVVRRDQLPARGTNYLFADPAGARNWFLIWVRVAALPGGGVAHYIYRDWPDAQTYGEWAVATEREVNDRQVKGWDGDAGPAQAGMGYGVTRYKQVILEAEKIRKPTSDIRNQDPYHARLLEKAGKGQEVSEEIAERYVDPRAGKSEHLAEAGGTCILEEFEAVQTDSAGKVTGPSMEFIPASGVNQDEGLTAVNELLDWNQEQPLCAVTNQPHLFVCEDCVQVRWMFENFTGRGGEKGACKDFADLVRYLALAKLEPAEGMSKGREGRGF